MRETLDTRWKPPAPSPERERNKPEDQLYFVDPSFFFPLRILLLLLMLSLILFLQLCDVYVW